MGRPTTDRREVLEYDVAIVGAGPAGLASAIRLKQLARDVSVCLLEKGAEVGSHILSGACMDPRALDELLPGWGAGDFPERTEVRRDRVAFLTERRLLSLPVSAGMGNRGKMVVSLGEVCRWLADRATELGVDVLPGFSGAEVIFRNGGVHGVVTGDFGVARDGARKPTFQPGTEVHARQTIFAEGCRGSLTRVLFETLGLRAGAQPQNYSIGLKEVWRAPTHRHEEGTVLHTLGWPMTSDTYGGGFLYHIGRGRVTTGFVVGLDYRNPWISPFDFFQRFKSHPAIADVLGGGERLGYGARAISAGGVQSLPALEFPGGVLIGDTAGFFNVGSMKGVHTAMKSGMLAAEAVFPLATGAAGRTADYTARIKESWLWHELYQVRNLRPGFRAGPWSGLLHYFADRYLLRGKAPWTMGFRHNHGRLEPAAKHIRPAVPKPDGKVRFDRHDSVNLSGTSHAPDQPCHLKLAVSEVPIAVNHAVYGSPESWYCPAGVYEIVTDSPENPRMLIHAENCLHCKSCDIKDPTQNIRWTVPEGGDGPNYAGM